MDRNYERDMDVPGIPHAISRLNDGPLLMKDYDTLVKSLARGNFTISLH